MILGVLLIINVILLTALYLVINNIEKLLDKELTKLKSELLTMATKNNYETTVYNNKFEELKKLIDKKQDHRGLRR